MIDVARPGRMSYRVPGPGRPTMGCWTFMRAKLVAASLLLLGASALAGCSALSRQMGMGKVSPDEFRIVTKAPLVVPPDYSLRPPAPGEPSPAELQPEGAARTALLGADTDDSRSAGEKLLDAQAGGDTADPLIRYVVDDEFGSLAHKDKSFADLVMFWRKGKAPAPTQAAKEAETSTPINPAVEAERIRKLTGDQPVVIARQGSGKVKLPGL